MRQIIPPSIKNRLEPVTRRLYRHNKGPIRGLPPTGLSVEPTNKCNLNCPYCLVGQQNTLSSTEHDLLPREFGFMEWDLYEKIIEDATSFGIKKMQLHFQGEPLLHKQFSDMVKLAKENGMHTQVFTNGLLLTEEKAEKILNAGLDMIRFSVDGASEETYQQNRVGGKFYRVYNNMKMIAKKALEDGYPTRIEWQFIAFRNNEHEIDKAKKMAEEIGVNFFVKTFAVTVPELEPVNPEYRRSLHIKPCIDIYRNIFVYWNGDVVPCCYDLEGQYVMGNLMKQTLNDIWNSPQYVDFRQRVDNAHINPDDEPSICKNCLKWGHNPQRMSSTSSKISYKELRKG